MYRVVKLSVLSLFLTSCSLGYDHKFISTSYTDLCLSANKDDCIDAINKKCESNYVIESMQKYEYYIDSDKIIIEFKCKEKHG